MRQFKKTRFYIGSGKRLDTGTDSYNEENIKHIRPIDPLYIAGAVTVIAFVITVIVSIV